MTSQTRRYRVFENPDSACAQVASEIAQLIRERELLGRKVILGLATGKTLLPLYQELIYQHREENLSFANVVAFNLAEYVGLPISHPASLRSDLYKNFFNHVDIPAENIHLLSGDGSPASLPKHCAAYEKEIQSAGEIDYLILGIGRNGHIALNEPGTPSTARTHVCELANSTRTDASHRFHKNLASVPANAVTVGCETLLEARRIALLAWGNSKARIVRRAIQGPYTPKVSASYLQKHPATLFYLDHNSAAQLDRSQ